MWHKGPNAFHLEDRKVTQFSTHTESMFLNEHTVNTIAENVRQEYVVRQAGEVL